MPDQADQARAQSPLAGVILCCTSINAEQRNELAKWATEMGAAHKYDLTSDVTHLVVGHIDTHKYKYVAKERPDVKVVTPKWVAAVRESWLQGGETDVEKLEEEHRVPTFFDLRICITGFEELSQRKYLEDTVIAHGAFYQGDLTKAVTHLIVAVPTGKKYDFARQHKIKTVSLEWITDSIERRMTLDETLYDPILPREERGKGAFKKLSAETTPLGKRLRNSAGEDGEGRRKLRRTASTKLGSQSSAIWNDITSGSFSGPKQEADDSWQDPKSDGLVSNEVVPAMNKAEIRRSASMDQFDGARDRPPRPKTTVGCFDGRVIYVYGFDRVKTAILQEHLQQNGAELAVTQEQLCSHDDSDLEKGFLITPSDTPRDALEDLPLVAEALMRVNEWWVEKCLYRKRIVDPTEEVICKPFPRIPIPGFEKMVVTSTLFTDYDRLHVSKVVKLMGATYDEILKDSVSVLICNSDSPQNPKVKFCLDRSIPVVTPSWLWKCISIGVRQPFDDHPLLLPARRSKGSSQQAQVRKSSGESTEPSLKERVVREHGSHNKLALSKAASPGRLNPGREESLENLEAGKPEKRQQARPSKRAMPFYESGSECDEMAGGPGAAASPDGDLAPPAYGDTASQIHLQELSPSEANAPRKPLTANISRAERKQPQHHAQPSNPTTITPPISCDRPSAAPVPPPTDSAALNTTMAALLAQKKQQQQNQSARPVSAGSDNGGARNRQRRKLGRAPSMVSNGSAPSSISAQTSFSTTAATTSASHAPDSEAAAVSWNATAPAASQALVWGDGEGEAERAEVIRRLGGKVLAEGEATAGDVMRAVERIGRVQDAGDEAGEIGGVGSRVMRRRAAEGRAL